MKNVVVVGGGAAGIIAAWRAANIGANVTLIEKTPRLGTKILISGGGKCNITHDGEIKDVLKAFRKNEADFIRPACYRFTNKNIVEMLTSRGLEVYTRPDGRIFPSNGTAKDVVAILQKHLSESSVKVIYKSPVIGISITNGGANGIYVTEGLIKADAVILATGGSSYPNSGTTGDGWAWAKQTGHEIVKIRAALAPIYLFLNDPDHQESPNIQSGIALRDVILKAKKCGKEIARWRGDLLFTHRGISGPCALGISRLITESEPVSEVSLSVDLFPDFSFEDLQEAIHSWVTKNPKKRMVSFLEESVPSKISEAVLRSSNLSLESIFSQLPKKDLNRLIETMKIWKLGYVKAVPLELGEVAAGGVSLNDIDTQTMQSRLCKGLYVCGEVLDIAGPVGGYNLQAAFSTGYVAGESAAQCGGSRPGI